MLYSVLVVLSAHYHVPIEADSRSEALDIAGKMTAEELAALTPEDEDVSAEDIVEEPE